MKDYTTAEQRLGKVSKPYNFLQALTVFIVGGAMATLTIGEIFFW